jgi:putative addiction module component (TIGR02574 family)
MEEPVETIKVKLTTPQDATVESTWDEEITCRVADLDSGKAKTVPWEDVRARISSKLTDRK